jgi:hypothetical protein
MPRLFVAAAIGVAFIVNAAADTMDPPARSRGPNGKEGCLSAPSGSAAPGKSGNLSDQLAQSNGVICPPSGVDPKMAAPPPGGGATPVIPPPGTPGGDPNTIPK